jgi:hypothetical protein
MSARKRVVVMVSVSMHVRPPTACALPLKKDFGTSRWQLCF